MATLAKSYGVAGEFFEKVLKGRLGTLCFHVDGARLGNVLRPDAGRELHAVTYTFAQFPECFRSRDAGYLPLTILPAKIVFGTGMSVAMGAILGN